MSQSRRVPGISDILETSDLSKICGRHNNSTLYGGEEKDNKTFDLRPVIAGG